MFRERICKSSKHGGTESLFIAIRCSGTPLLECHHTCKISFHRTHCNDFKALPERVKELLVQLSVQYAIFVFKVLWNQKVQNQVPVTIHFSLEKGRPPIYIAKYGGLIKQRNWMLLLLSWITSRCTPYKLPQTGRHTRFQSHSLVDLCNVLKSLKVWFLSMIEMILILICNPCAISSSKCCSRSL